MSGNEKRALAPRLRFPEFRDVMDCKRLGDIVRFASGGTPSKDEPDYWNGIIPWISASSMYDTKIAGSDLKVTELAIGNGTRIAKKGSLLILVRGSMLFNRVPMGIAAIDVAFNQDVKAMTIGDGVIGEFLLNQLLSLSSRIPINETGIGAGKIETDTLSNLRIVIPSLLEQQKIADCLSSLDELMTAETQKLDTLKTHKKGLMQQLFPREGETVPRLRFSEFRNGSEWTNQPFERFVIKSFYGTSNSTSEKGKYPVLRMGNMVDGKLNFSNLAYIDLDRNSFEAIRLLKGDILLNRTNSLDLVGKISIFDLDSEYITASYIVAHRLDNESLNPVFCNFILNTPQYQAKIKALARPSVSQANINPTTFRQELNISVPLLAEQQRIADHLSSLDDLITAQTQKIAILKTHKKALMQQIFPMSNES
jgi:type I restriction enzyme S subunit